jgi:hypothetical protein
MAAVRCAWGACVRRGAGAQGARASLQQQSYSPSAVSNTATSRMPPGPNCTHAQTQNAETQNTVSARAQSGRIARGRRARCGARGAHRAAAAVRGARGVRAGAASGERLSVLRFEPAAVRGARLASRTYCRPLPMMPKFCAGLRQRQRQRRRLRAARNAAGFEARRRGLLRSQPRAARGARACEVATATRFCRNGLNCTCEARAVRAQSNTHMPTQRGSPPAARAGSCHWQRAHPIAVELRAEGGHRGACAARRARAAHRAPTPPPPPQSTLLLRPAAPRSVHAPRACCSNAATVARTLGAALSSDLALRLCPSEVRCRVSQPLPRRCQRCASRTVLRVQHAAMASFTVEKARSTRRRNAAAKALAPCSSPRSHRLSPATPLPRARTCLVIMRRRRASPLRR